MFSKNDVIRWQDNDYRLLCLSDETAWLFPIKSKGVSLQETPLHELQQAETSGSAILIDDPFKETLYRHEISSNDTNSYAKSLAKMSANLEFIKPITSLGDSFYTDKAKRSLAFKSIVQGDPTKRRRLHRLLAQYMRQGQSDACLFPDYGKNTGSRNCNSKPGRKYDNKDITPPPVDDEIRQLFEKGISKYKLRKDGISLAKTHCMVVKSYIDLHPDKTPETAPSLYQLRYFYYLNTDPCSRLQATTPEIKYNKDVRSLHGSVFDTTKGIGERYEIDSTILGCHIVSENDPTKVIGQPTLYCVVDSYSKLIVGVDVCIESAQYTAAASAIRCAIASKESYLSRVGSVLEPSGWPAQGIPHTLVADNGELLGKQIQNFERSHSMRLVYTSAYRGDQKGSVERALGLIQDIIRPHLIAPTSNVRKKKEGFKDTRKDAALNLSDVRNLVLNATYELNKRALEKTPPDYPSTSSPTPIAIWNWCIQQGGRRCCLQRAPSDNELERALMPRFKATISREGIKSELIIYDCTIARAKGWFERDPSAPRPKDVYIAIDPNNVENAWLFETKGTNPMSAWPCQLSSSCQRFAGFPLFEVRKLRQEQKESHQKAVLANTLNVAETHAKNHNISTLAKAAKRKSTTSTKIDTSLILKNKRDERIAIAQKSNGKYDKYKLIGKRAILKSKPSSPYEYPDDIDEY